MDEPHTTTLTLYLNLATVLIAVYGIFYSLSVAVERGSDIHEDGIDSLPEAVFVFGKICWAMVLLLVVAVLGAGFAAWNSPLDGSIWLLIAAYAAVTILLLWVTKHYVKWRRQ